MVELDCDGKPPMYVKGDRVICLPNKMKATVIRQLKSWDGSNYWFWGNVELLYDDKVRGISNSWQLQKLTE